MDYTFSVIDILLCTFRNMDACVCDHLMTHVLRNLPTCSNKALSCIINTGLFGWKQFFLNAGITEVYVQAVW